MNQQQNHNRYIGTAGEPGKGPSLIIIAGMHGNEPAGIHATKFLFDFITNNKLQVNGFIAALKGNLSALEKGVRFIDQDLNRLWTVDHLNNSNDTNIREIRELRELKTELDKIITSSSLLLDLHTFSAQSGIFSMPSDNDLSRNSAAALGVPFVNRLSQVLPNTAVNFFAEKGISTLAFEAGNHQNQESVDNMISALFIVCASTGILNPEDIPGINTHKKHLHGTANGLPQKMELVYRYKLDDPQDFKMNPGFTNFQKITKGEKLAIHQGDPVKAPMDGYILMPLYQKIGSDGFFIVQ